MHHADLKPWTHDHVFHAGNEAGERGARLVLIITAVTMVVEITAGWWFNSMALLADGWHMSSHALALSLSAFAYAASRRYARDARFAFGTWKIEILAGFTSALLLIVVAFMMVAGSIERLIVPQDIRFGQAISVAVLGLIVNVVCVFILGGAHGHDHGDESHGHAHGHGHGHDDLNLRSAYLHVLADAATSVLAILALLGGMFLGWQWLDPTMGIVGAVLVLVWAWGLLKDTGRVLLDREMDHPVSQEIRDVVEQELASRGETRIADLHVWRVGRSQYATIVSLVTHDHTVTPDLVRRLLSVHEELVHVSVEINHCH